MKFKNCWKHKITSMLGVLVIIASVASVLLGHADWRGAAVGITAGSTLIGVATDPQ